MFPHLMHFLLKVLSNSTSVNNLATRSVSATVFLLIMVGSMLLGQIATSLLFLVVTFFSIDEFLKLSVKSGAKPGKGITLLIGMAVYSIVAAIGLFALDGRWLMLLLPLMLLLMVAELYRNSASPFLNIGWMLLPILYIAIPFALLTYFFDADATDWKERSGTILGFFIILWLNDTGAYFVGSVAGKHRLFERISPKKSWEGSIGGGAIALLTAWGISFIFTQYTIPQWLAIAMVIIVAGTYGDLVESMLKRSIGIKDSGTIMPGHGGLLDRFDAVLLAAPFVFALLTFF